MKFHIVKQLENNIFVNSLIFSELKWGGGRVSLSILN